VLKKGNLVLYRHGEVILYHDLGKGGLVEFDEQLIQEAKCSHARLRGRKDFDLFPHFVGENIERTEGSCCPER
jgi:hypothetical protein